jgi:hypothetical protein
LREAIGPEKAEPGAEPQRPFGREEGGQDVKQVVWIGHTVETPEGQRYFGAAGLTEAGYYRAAEVQVYGTDELWRWRPERYSDLADATASAERMAESRLQREAPLNGEQPPWKEFFEKELTNDMAIPDHVKAQADAAVAETGQKEKIPVQNMDAPQAVDNYTDRGKDLDAMRDQKRQDALLEKQEKTPEPTPEPER